MNQCAFSRAIAAIVLLLATVSAASARTALSARNDAAPKGCKWQRIIADPIADAATAASSPSAASAASATDAAGRPDAPRHLLTCKLRTLSSIDALIGNLSVYQTDRISTLRLECSDVLFFESSLEPAPPSGAPFLATLRQLRELQIDFCKIRNVPSMVLRELRDLRALSVRTHNSDWNVMSMELHPEALRGLTELRDLDLGDNNIWSVPTEVFCPLFSLRRLNLTLNHLTDMAQLGFADWNTGPHQSLGKACNTGLETLDLSHNHIQKVPDSSLSALVSLRTLLLQENQLTAVVDRAFAGLQSLNVLNMSSNRLIALPADLFQATAALTQLHLQNNTLSALAPGLLAGLEHLEVLDVSHNRLGAGWIQRSPFEGLIRLVVLNVGFNQLTTIDANVFRGLYSLQILNLEQNAIETIAGTAFADLKNLHALTLSNNRLQTLDTFHLSELSVLTQLFLDGNRITGIADRCFENLTSLSDLSLNDNRLEAVPRGIRRLRHLKSLDLGKNRIAAIGRSSFEGLGNLLGLRLVDNQLVNISRDAFAALSSVHVLNLASNQIRHVDQSAFVANPTLRAIRLDNNRLEDITGVFAAVPNLVWLNVSDNQLRWFDYGHVPASLEWLDMHRNNITELGNYFGNRQKLQIKMLDVSYNRLRRIDDQSVPDTIETLFVNNNGLVEVEVGTFLAKRSIAKCVLYGNAIRKLDIGAFALAPVADGREMPVFYLGDNPIHCDCHMEWLQRINELSHLRQHPRVLDLDLVQCTVEHERGDTLRPLMDLGRHDFLCKYEQHCAPLCHCCDYVACDCKWTCPDRCSCLHDHTWTANVVDCGQTEYTEVPERLPMDATVIYLDGNQLGELGRHAFIGKRRLESLYLNASRVSGVQNTTFVGVPGLKRLHLEHNQLRELRDDAFAQLGGLTELNVEHNAIDRVGGRALVPLAALEVLRMGGNRVAEFEPWQQLSAAMVAGSLQQVSMEAVRWRCECEELLRMEQWLRRVNEGEFEAEQVRCSGDDDRLVVDALRVCARSSVRKSPEASVGATTLDGNRTDGQNAAGGSTNADHSNSTSSELLGVEYVPIFAAVLITLIAIVLVAAIVCIFRQPLRLWAHSRYGIRLCSDPTQLRSADRGGSIAAAAAADHHHADKLYDAYVVCSVRDDSFVTQVLAPELRGYQLCVHHRDIPAASSAYLNDALQAAADASRKLLLVVSMNFLQHEWSQPQFRLALQKCIENVAPAMRGRRLVLLLTAPVEIVGVDPIMQVLMQRCPVVSWGERRFWDKLRYALPDVQRPEKQRSGAGAKKVVNVRCNPGLRYTPAPINVDVWSKAAAAAAARPACTIPMTERVMRPGAGAPGGQQMLQQQQPAEQEAMPSQQHYAVAAVQNYMCRSSASSLGHVYSTIPEVPTGNPAGPADGGGAVARGAEHPDGGAAYFV